MDRGSILTGPSGPDIVRVRSPLVQTIAASGAVPPLTPDPGRAAQNSPAPSTGPDLDPRDANATSRVNLPLWIAAIYATSGIFWILGTDWVVDALFDRPDDIAWLHAGKGFVFVFMTSGLIYFLLARDILIISSINSALAESDARFRLAMGTSREAVWEVDLRTRRIYYSPGLRELLGYREERQGNPVETWMERIHPDDRMGFEQAMADHHVGKTPRCEHVHRLRRQDGQYLWVLSRGQVIKSESGEPVRAVGIKLDITERKTFEDNLRRVNRALAAICAANRAIVAAQATQGIYESACAALTRDDGYRMAWIAVRDPSEPPRVRIVATGGVADKFYDQKSVWALDGERGQGPSGTALRTGKPAVFHDVLQHPQCVPWRATAKQHGIAAALTVPIFDGGSAVAVLGVASADPTDFGADEVVILETLAEEIAYARTAHGKIQLLQTSEGERELARRQAQSALLGSVQVLSAALETRDPYTAGHQARVAALCVAIGQRLGLAELELEGLRLGAILHDIGKIGIPSDLLAKPSRVSAEEFALIKQHTVLGHEIVRQVEYPWPIARMVLEHHERLDGSGYPNGLRGDAICLEARILGVADVVEAMMSHRPYRPALGQDAALREIAEGRGIRYDSNVVDACTNLFHGGIFRFDDANGAADRARREAHRPTG